MRIEAPEHCGRPNNHHSAAAAIAAMAMAPRGASSERMPAFYHFAATLATVAFLLFGLLWTGPAVADQASMTPAIANVVVAEGGWTADQRDPGNRGGTGTLNGVTQRVYDFDRDLRKLPRRPLTRAMLGTPEWIAERDAIYERLYWEPCAGPVLPRGVDQMVLNMCVNAGIVRGWSMLMKVLGLVTDRPWSPLLEILPAIERKGARTVIRAYGDENRRFYRALASRPPPPQFGVFLIGWLNRETHMRAKALAMTAPSATASMIVMTPQPYRMGKAIDDPEELIP